MQINPVDVAFNASGAVAYVTLQSGAQVAVINVATNTVINDINVGTNPTGIALNPSGSFIYVMNGGTGTVSIINPVTNTVVNTINVS